MTPIKGLLQHELIHLVDEFRL